ncbi:MAG: hypothetical protein IPK21_23465 [Haliscomenobacter sp.]|nr:hypothetical protein [Haliscomenobacter sp.]
MQSLGWLDPGAFGTLVWGGGFALGAALQYPDHYIWILDGGGRQRLQPYRVRHPPQNGDSKVCAVIGNNGSWEQIARDQIPMLGTATATRNSEI